MQQTLQKNLDVEMIFPEKGEHKKKGQFLCESTEETQFQKKLSEKSSFCPWLTQPSEA